MLGISSEMNALTDTIPRSDEAILKELKDLPTPMEIEELSKSRVEELPDVEDQTENQYAESEMLPEVPEADSDEETEDEKPGTADRPID